MKTPSIFTSVAVAIAVLTSGTAMAQSLDPGNCTVDPVVVGNSTGNSVTTAGPRHGFSVVIRDSNNQPMANVLVDLVLGNGVGHFYKTQVTGTTQACLNQAEQIEKATDANGVVNFTPRMGGYDNSGANCWVQVGTENIQLNIPFRSTDIDGNGTTGLSDYTTFASKWSNGGTYHAELDFDNSGTMNLADFAIFAAEYNSGASGSLCP